MPDGFRLDLDEDAIADLADGDDAEELALDAGDLVAERAQQLARAQGLVRTGEGVESIQAVPGRDDDGAYSDVGWDRDHFYMGFAELGTEHQPATPFLRPALEQTQL